MAPDERMTLSRNDIEVLLKQYPACGCHPQQKTEPTAGRMNTKQVAAHFQRAPSTVRGWIQDGWFGAPETLKPNGRDYEIPGACVDRVDRMLDEGKRFIEGEWRDSSEKAPTHKDGGASAPEALEDTNDASPVSAGTPERKPPGLRPLERKPPEQRRPRERPRSTAGRYGGWQSSL